MLDTIKIVASVLAIGIALVAYLPYLIETIYKQLFNLIESME